MRPWVPALAPRKERKKKTKREEELRYSSEMILWGKFECRLLKSFMSSSAWVLVDSIALLDGSAFVCCETVARTFVSGESAVPLDPQRSLPLLVRLSACGRLRLRG